MQNTLSYSQIEDSNIDNICDEIKVFMSNSMNLNVSNIVNKLPHIVMFP